MTKQTILIAGGSGLIGRQLSHFLHAEGFSVRILTRNPRAEGDFFWDPATGQIDPAALQQVYAIINLAGAGIADRRWTNVQKRRIIDSRVQAADALAEAISRVSEKPQLYLSASAVGYYGHSQEKLVRENDEPENMDFMAECCHIWEHAADRFAQTTGIRTLKFRIGIVLAASGGALPKTTLPLRWGLGIYFGDGRNWWPWIHLDDLCRMFVWALSQPGIEGVYNAVSPQPVRGLDLLQTTAKILQRKALYLPAPAWALRLVLGEMSAVVLNSNRVSADKILQAGFRFEFPELTQALSDLFRPKVR